MYDLAVLGSGPGGYVAAIRAAQLGAKVCVVERDRVGGTCLNRGCIPSKAFSESARRMSMARENAKFGVVGDVSGFNLAACVSRKDEVVDELVTGIEKLFDGHGIKIIRGEGRFVEPMKLEVTTDEGVEAVEARSMIVATGSRPVDLVSMPVDGQRIVNSDALWSMEELPESMVIVGGGVIGCELASIFEPFGVKVTVLELLDKLLATEDKDVSRAISRSFKDRGIEARTGVAVKSAKNLGDHAVVELESGETIECDRVVVAVGRAYNSQAIGLEEIGVEVDAKGRVVVDDEMATSVEGVWAVGDVVGHYMLAHVAFSEGMVAVHNALGKKYWVDYSAVPSAVFTHPEVGSVGISEQELKAKNVPYTVGRFAMGANGKAQCMGETEGFIKILSHAETGRILGSSVVGPHASDIIAELTLAIRMEASPGDIVTTIHTHPTVSEVVLEAAEDTMGLAIHKKGRSAKRRDR